MTSCGIRYSNIEPLHDTSTGSPPASVSRRPSANQLSCGNWPCATARKLLKPRFGREQVVEARIAPTLGHVVADREQAPRRVVQEVELRRRELPPPARRVAARSPVPGPRARCRPRRRPSADATSRPWERLRVVRPAPRRLRVSASPHRSQLRAVSARARAAAGLRVPPAPATATSTARDKRFHRARPGSVRTLPGTTLASHRRRGRARTARKGRFVLALPLPAASSTIRSSLRRASCSDVTPVASADASSVRSSACACELRPPCS